MVDGQSLEPHGLLSPKARPLRFRLYYFVKCSSTVQLYFFKIIHKKIGHSREACPRPDRGAGVQFLGVLWIPAFAGMTFFEVCYIKLHRTAIEII